MRCAALLLMVTATTAVLPWDAENKPNGQWPAQTAAESNAAWPAGQQPLNLIAWPKEQGQPSSCWKITVVQDTAKGWSGSCENLEEITGLKTEAACRLNCEKNPACAIWQFTTGMLCLQGTSLECDDTMQVSQPLIRGQRIQHGDVRVLKDMTGFEVAHLRPLGMGSSNDQAVEIQRCKEFCYTLLPCEYWSFGQGGCFVEDPRVENYRAEYPLTLTAASETTSFAASVMAGEYLQHICPAHGDDAEKKDGVLPVLGALQPSLTQPNSVPVIAGVTILSILVVGITVGCCVCRSSSDEKAPRSRSIGLGGRDEESEEERTKPFAMEGSRESSQSMQMAEPGSPVRPQYHYAPVDQASPAHSQTTVKSSPFQQTPIQVPQGPPQNYPQSPPMQQAPTPFQQTVPTSFNSYGGAYANVPSQPHSFTSLAPSQVPINPSAPNSFTSLGPGQAPPPPSAPHSFNSLTPQMTAQPISPKAGPGSPVLFHH
eukprot:CAMPEP_0197633016 /NCGR_PEP_ID=MMETSP1338-20131121/9487_1 /TAXON_ID=43686 ORGANISM="Pelagodinium beii, Strain RCC1491" /NCGR_SAMPLE_ID=MMETSP1338 /ASSEMBLY_ACC=CAM_ASM_000754 /LENGTH=484 /DNA_ID=CAMNT_0043204599 /DNA_START=51 /DNA_END=1505 /DNA_ORIENTATION=+